MFHSLLYFLINTFKMDLDEKKVTFMNNINILSFINFRYLIFLVLLLFSGTKIVP